VPAIGMIVGRLSLQLSSASFTSSYPASPPSTDCHKTNEPMATVAAGARISERRARQRGQSKCVIEFAVCQQPVTVGHHGAAKLQHQASFKIELESLNRCQRWVNLSVSRGCGIKAAATSILQLTKGDLYYCKRARLLATGP
jgi:hypothetical protein